jgi:Ca2+-transporting ATPase
LWQLFLNQFKDFMVLVLLAATAVSGLLGEYADAVAILIIVVVNAILGFIQEYRAERSMEALRQLAAPEARVIRSGQERRITTGGRK